METYIELYQHHSEKIKANSAKAFNKQRDEAFEVFKSKGFPTTKDEAYLNSRLQDKIDIDYGLNIHRVPMMSKETDLYECKAPLIEANIGFMINDKFFIDDNQKKRLPEGVIFCSLAQAEKQYPDLIEKYLFSRSSKSNDVFTHFNASFVQDGYFIYIPPNIVVENPLQLINILHSANPLMTFSHNLIVIDKGAEMKMLVCDHADENIDFFMSRVTEVIVEDNAKFEYYVLENTTTKTNNLAQMFVSQKDNSNVVINGQLLVCSTSRNHMEVDIDGENANLFLGGMLIADGNQQAENFTVIRHNKPNSTSNELFKYILDEQSHGIFSGIIVVDKEAQNTISRQTNRNICLTKDAVMNSRPQLEIYADDVKCGHGATTGQLDNDAKFYMKQRGIDDTTARFMLLSAFLQDVIDNVTIGVLRDRLTIMVEKRLQGADYHCEECCYH